MNGAGYNRTLVDVSLLVLRVVVGTIMAAHGVQKVFGWFDGPGLTATVQGTATTPGMGPIGYLVAIGECFGGLGMIFGFLTRFSAASNIVIMIGAIAMVHGKNGFFMKNGGLEYNLALIGLLVPIVLLGAGQYSIGRFLPLPKQGGSDRPIVPLE
jgi:putative oxidoreductase